MNTYKAGTKVFCDFHFGGKPKGIAIKVIEPGNGKMSGGKVLVKLSETIGGYRKGETLEVEAWQCVPVKQELKSTGSMFRRIKTDFEWID